MVDMIETWLNVKLVDWMFDLAVVAVFALFVLGAYCYYEIKLFLFKRRLDRFKRETELKK